MNCPHCNEIVPDTNYKCPHCRKALQTVKEPSEFRKEHTKPSSFNMIIVVIFIIVIGLAGIVYTTLIKESGGEAERGNSPSSPLTRVKERAVNGGGGQSGGETGTPDTSVDSDTGSDNADDSIEGENGDVQVGYVINLSNPGEEVYVEDFVQGGKTTIFDFYSDFCPPCRQFSPWLLELDNRRNDIIVFKVDVNRRGISGIDWKAPVVKQYNIKRLPYFMIYDPSGTRTHDGTAATTRVVALLQSEGILK